MPPAGFEPRNPSKRAAADPRLGRLTIGIESY